MVDNESIKMKNIVSEGKHGDLIERNVTIDTKEVLNFQKLSFVQPWQSMERMMLVNGGWCRVQSIH